MDVLISNNGEQLVAQFSDGSIHSYTEVPNLVEHLYELRIRPDEVKAVDWKVDIERAPLAGTMVALYHGLRKRYQQAGEILSNSSTD